MINMYSQGLELGVKMGTLRSCSLNEELTAWTVEQLICNLKTAFSGIK